MLVFMAAPQQLEYMYLVFAQDKYYEVAVGGALTRLAADSTSNALDRYWRDNVQPDDEQKTREWRDAFADFKERTRVNGSR